MNEMKRYVNMVERCLRLDPATRLRVMNDQIGRASCRERV